MILPHGQTTANLLREDFKEHNFIFTQWKKMIHFSILRSIKVKDPSEESNKDDKTAVTVKGNSKISRAMSPTAKEMQGQTETNLSNQWRIYAKMEANYHLSNKFALFFNMSKYYKSIDRDPFDILPITYHIKKGTQDKVYYQFVAVFR